MSEHSTKPSSDNQEIDLSFIFKAIGDFFKNVLVGIINIFRFYFRHKFILLGLIIIGVALGYFWEKSFDKIYTNNILVKPNFESTEYLYSKLDAVSLKINQGDTLFLKEVFGKNYDRVNSVEIRPIVDIYNFVSENETNQELFELLFEEEGDINFIENPINSRSFKFHRIYLEIEGENKHKDLSEILIRHLNKNAYFKELKIVSVENLQNQINENQSIINQIDSIIANSKKGTSLNSNSTGLTFNDNQGLRDLLGQKQSILEQKVYLQNRLVDQSEIIRVVDANYKVLNTENLIKKDKKKIFPLLLILLYSLFFLVRYIYKESKAIKP